MTISVLITIIFSIALRTGADMISLRGNCSEGTTLEASQHSKMGKYASI